MLATTSDKELRKKMKREGQSMVLSGADRRRLIHVAAEEAQLGGWLEAADGSKFYSGGRFAESLPRPARCRVLHVVGSDTALRHSKQGKCVVVMRDGDSEGSVRKERPKAIIVPRLPGPLGGISSTAVRSVLSEEARLEELCGPAVMKALVKTLADM